MSKVVSLANYKKQKEIDHATVKCEPKDEDAGLTFEEIAKKNKEKEEKLKKERLQHNKKVKRDYRL